VIISRRIRRLALLGGCAATLSLASLVPLGGAQAQTAGKVPGAAPGKDPVIGQFIKQVGAAAIDNQNALSLFRGWMFKQPGFARSGYVGTIDDLARKATTIMWYGPRTPLLTAIIREGARRGIAVSIQHRRYSLQQINAATAAIWQQAAAGEWAGFKVSAIAGISATDDGLTVEGTYTAAPAGLRAPQVRSLATVVQGVPVRIVPGQTTTLASGRDADVAPFNAGGLMYAYHTHAGYCTSGFAVLINGVDHTTTARHCDDGYKTGDYVVANAHSAPSPPPTNEWYGNWGPWSGDGGGMVMGNGGFFWMFNHGWNSTDHSEVIGYENLGLKDLVCTEGGNSGEHCNVKVINMSVSVDDGFGTFSTIQAQQTGGSIAAMEGDSGGPVMSLVNTSSGEVRAAGMIQAINIPTLLSNCGASYTPLLCSSIVDFSSMQTIVSTIPGASLYTG
jgi:hypothetical protein